MKLVTCCVRPCAYDMYITSACSCYANAGSVNAARDGVENWELTEMKSLRNESPVMEQLWTDAIVELESELGRDWKGLMHHHSMSDPTYVPRS